MKMKEVTELTGLTERTGKESIYVTSESDPGEITRGNGPRCGRYV